MGPNEKANRDMLMEMVKERDQMRRFKHQFYDRERGNTLRGWVTIDKVMEKANLSKKKWSDIPVYLHPWIYNAFDNGAFGFAKDPKVDPEQMIFAGETRNHFDNDYYFAVRSGKDFGLSRLWIEGGVPRVESINHDLSLGEVIETVDRHLFDRKPETRGEAVDQTRDAVKERLNTH